MKILPLAAFTATVLAASLPLVAPVQAGTGIQRCVAEDGTTIYTDTACALFAASTRPLPSDVLNRIAREESRTSPAPEVAGPVELNRVAVSRRSPAAGCARTPTQLSMDLRGSFALGDVNRLAESYHWVGVTQKQSQPIMHRLELLSGMTLEDTLYFDAQIGSGGTQLADSGSGTRDASAGVIQVRLGGTSRQIVDFEVARYAGCYFIKY